MDPSANIVKEVCELEEYPLSISKLEMLRHVAASVKTVGCAHQAKFITDLWINGPALQVTSFAVFFSKNGDKLVVAYHPGKGRFERILEVTGWDARKEDVAAEIARVLKGVNVCVACATCD